MAGIYNRDIFVQKPTARLFYDKCVRDNPDLAKFETEAIRQKMKNFRSSYTKANDWRNSTGSGLSEENSEKTISGNYVYNWISMREQTIHFFYSIITERLNKMCPFWDYLDEIFSRKTSLNPVALYESGQQNLKSETNDPEYIIDDNVDIDFAIDTNETSFQTTQSSETNDALDVMIPFDTMHDNNDENDTQFALTKRLQKKPRANQNSTATLLMEMSKMRNETNEKKLELEAKRIALEEKRIDRDYEIRKMEAEARKIEAENLRMQLMERFQRQNDNSN